MSTDLLAAALEDGDAGIDTQCESGGSDQTQEQIDDKNKLTGDKRKTTDSDGSGQSKKSLKAEPPFTPVPPTDGPVDCVFVEGECIPLWPQYRSRGVEGQFLRIGARESWMLKVMSTSRRSLHRGDERSEDREKPLSNKEERRVASAVCNDLLHKMREVIVEAKVCLRKREGSIPDVLPIQMNGCEVLVSSRTRNFHIQTDNNAANWIQKGLRVAVSEYMGRQIKAISHTHPKPQSSFCGNHGGIRGKVYWVQDKSAWELKFEGENGADSQFCREHALILKVNSQLSGEESLQERRKTFDAACRVWNAVDKSGRRRIPQRVESGIEIVSVKAISHDESQSECGESE